MPAPYPELHSALSVFMDRLDAELRTSGYAGVPVSMFLAGGLAVNYYCGSRYTGDIDASFSRRLLIPEDKGILEYIKRDGTKSLLYFDRNYNTAFALLHEKHEDDSIAWEGIGNERRLIQLRVLAPVDLAVSKIARFSNQDRRDIIDLATCTGFAYADLEARAHEALGNYIGNKTPLFTTLSLIERDLKRRCVPLPDSSNAKPSQPNPPCR